MIIEVSHETTYRYDVPVRGVAQSLRLTPSVFDGQKVLDWSVEVEGGIRGARFRDGAGDTVESWSVRGPVEAVTIRVTGRVETVDRTGRLTGHRETMPPAAYLRATPMTGLSTAIIALAEAALGGETDDLSRAHKLSGAVADAVAYEPGATEAQTTAAEALETGAGVCQDHAHLLIAAARHAGLPARYVSGYLASDQDGVPHEAAHAWAEVWIRDFGWVGFDPANRCCPDERYVRLGSGADAQDAAPIRGVAQGAGSETLEVAVAVHSAQQ